MNYQCRSNVGSALTRRANLALKGKVASVKVRCSGFANGCGKVSGDEIEALMFARQILTEAGIYCSPIQTQFKVLGPCFYIARDKESAGVA